MTHLISTHLASPLLPLPSVCLHLCSSAILTKQRASAKWTQGNGDRWIDGTSEVARGKEGTIWKNVVRCTASTTEISGVHNASGKKLVRDSRLVTMCNDISSQRVKILNSGSGIPHEFVPSSLSIKLVVLKYWPLLTSKVFSTKLDFHLPYMVILPFSMWSLWNFTIT